MPTTETFMGNPKMASWLTTLLLSALAISVSPHKVLTRTSEVERALNPVLSSYEVLRFEPGEIERQIRTDGELRFRFDETYFHFNLKPHDMRAPNYRAVETGPGGVRRMLPPQPVRTFKGTLAGREDTRVRFNLTGRGVEGVVFASEGWIYLEPLRNYLPSAQAGELVVYRHANVKPGEDFQCGVSLPERLQRGVARVEARTQTETSDGPTNYVVDVATEADYEYVQEFGGSAEANSKIEGILNVVEGVYQSELLLQIRIDFQHAWATKDESYPYTATNANDLLNQFADYWNTHYATQEDYDLAHLWSGYSLDFFSGLAHLGTVCKSRSRSYGLSRYVYGNPKLDYSTPAHEIGHNFGAVHPEFLADSCVNTVMVGGALGSGRDPKVTFCQFSRQEIADHVADYNSCLATQTITLQPPSGCTAMAPSSSSINLTWEDNSTNESGFVVQRRRLGSGIWAQIETTAADATTFSNERLFSESTYIYRVQAFNDSESSAYSNEAEATTTVGSPVVADWRIHTIAGKSDNGDTGPATEAVLGDPQGLAVDSSGNLYIADARNDRIRKVNSSGNITTIAGTGVEGYSGDGGKAVEAKLDGPRGVTVDGSGNLYIADSGNRRIRKVDTSGNITTVAGTGVEGYSGDGGKAVEAKLGAPLGVTVDGSGNLYIADSSNRRIRKVDTSGTITTVAGTGVWGFSGDGGTATEARLSFPRGLALDTSGNLYIADATNCRVRRVDASGNISTVAGTGVCEDNAGLESNNGDGGQATEADLGYMIGLALDSAGNLYIADTTNNRVRKVDTSGTITTVAGTGRWGYSGDGGRAVEAWLGAPLGLAVDASGNLYIGHADGQRVRKVDTSGIITTFAGIGESGFSGDGGPAVSARLNHPTGLAVDNSGNLYIADSENHRIRRVDSSGIITTIAGTGVPGFSGDGDPAIGARLFEPKGVAVDNSGNLYIADHQNFRVRKVDTSGIMTTIAGNGANNTFGPDGVPATKSSVNGPGGVAVDAAGNVYIADMGNSQIRKVDTSGIITSVAGIRARGDFSGDGGPAVSTRLNHPTGLAVDTSGNLYIADSGNDRIRRVDTSGTITTVAGIGDAIDSPGTGPAIEAVLHSPGSVAVDSSGNLYITDTWNDRIRRVDSSGILTTIAGAGVRGDSGDGGPAIEAQLNWPSGVAVDDSGNVYVADTDNHRIRFLTTDTTAPTVDSIAIASVPLSQATYSAKEVIRVMVTFSEPMAVAGMPQLAIEVGEVDRAAVYESGMGAVLLFAYPVNEGDSDTDGVSIGANGLTLGDGRIRDLAFNDAELSHNGLSADAGHKVEGIRPRLAETGGAVVDGAALTLTYDEPLDEESVPPENAFTVSGGNRARTVSEVAVAGRAVVLTLDPEAEPGEAGIQVSYRVPTGTGASPVRDGVGNEALGLSNQGVTNTTRPKVRTVEISSDPGSDRTYAAGDDIHVTVTFSGTVAVTGSPQLRLELGGGLRTADYESGTGTAALVFEYEVAEGESDIDGVGVEADSLSGGTIKDTSDNPAELDHEGLAADAGHKVDGDRPRLAASGGAVVNGTTLTLTYNEPLAGSSSPRRTTSQ